MSRNKWIVLSLLLVALLSGCWNRNEPERMLYVYGLGIDYKDGEYNVYVQIIDYKKVAKLEQPNTDPKQSETGFATGKTIDEAIFNIYNSADQRIYWGQLTFIILSEEALKNGAMQSAMDTFLRYRETRYQVLLYGTADSVKDVLLTVPIVNTAITLSRLGDPKNTYDQSSSVEPVDIRRMVIGLNEPGHEMVIPYMEVSENWETVTGKDKIAQLAGGGLITPKEFKGFLDVEKLSGLKWMNEKTQRGEVTFSLNSEEDFMTAIFQKIKVKVTPVVEGDTVKFDIDVRMQGEVSAIPIKINKDEIRKKAEQEIKKQIEETYKEALKLDVDIYRLSEYLYRKDVKAWKRLQEKGKVGLSENSIRTLNVKIIELNSDRKTFTEKNR
ncbi:Ger(x)C family spore germination protein [Mammaliicoccus sciuri]|uniref:Ger(x)C family spore germination protein n=1 Tax=Sporosarcina TaxID=1569 RepID=UPI001C8EF7D1|nr:Ger(x)C family spore germination protein [Sporosarcina aquimarina]MBY0223842.1 Ger(x)C family spore germination protein [Sporosarcina aquimarina]